MPLLPSNTDYTDRDFTALLKRFESMLGSVFPKWTKNTRANLANLLKELPCFSGDVLGFYQDNQAGESRITTATQMRNMIALVKTLGYQPRSPRAAQVDVTIVLTAPVPAGRSVTFTPPWLGQNNPLTITTEDLAKPVAFELQSTVTIGAGLTSTVASVKNSRRIGNPSDLAHDPGFSFISTDLPSQSFQLPESPYLDGSAVVADAVGALVLADSNSLVTAGPNDRVYRIEIDENGFATFIFGDGVCGVIPSGVVRGAFEVGGGSVGNVAGDTLKRVDGQFIDSHGDSVQIDSDSITHDEASGGLDGEDIESVRENAPISIQTLSRTVTKEDYENQAVLAGMKRALMITQSENAGLQANTAVLYCVPMGLNGQGGKMSFGQKTDVLANITQKPNSLYPNAKPGIVGYGVSITTAPYVDVGIFARVYLKTSADPIQTGRGIKEAIQDFFALLKADGTRNGSVDFGLNLGALSPSATTEIALSKLSTIIDSCPGIRELGDADADFRLSAYRVTDVTDGYTSGASPAQLIQGLQHSDVPLSYTDFPRLKGLTWGSATPDILILDGDRGDAQLYP